MPSPVLPNSMVVTRRYTTGRTQLTTNAASAAPMTIVRVRSLRHMLVEWCALQTENGREPRGDLFDAGSGFCVVERHRLERVDGRDVLRSGHTAVQRNLNSLGLRQQPFHIGDRR